MENKKKEAEENAVRLLEKRSWFVQRLT